ncbi:MAG: carbon monoxide dehydrogenase [Dehalococcoidales bacterium]|nr:carbon monoxide dehydrogenase [Dehalococcoidales bacterium]
MTFSIAVAGKGGSGKTSVTSLVIRYLKNKNMGPILAIDADANANLGDSLGLAVRQTLGGIIASFNEEKIDIPAGMTKENYLTYRFNEAMVESPGLDLLTMGRGEGPECYCYPNVVLRKVADSLAGNYTYVVMDNEAGMEHLSRRTTQNIDALLLVSNHSIKGVRTLARIRDLVSELGLVVKKQFVIVNMVPDVMATTVSEELAKLNLEPAVLIPEDKLLYQYDVEAKPLLDLPDSSNAVSSVDKLMNQILGRN